MSTCRTDSLHDWQYMYRIGNTKSLPQAVFGCHCGMAKRVDMRWEFGKVHPDERVAHMRARAEIAEENEDEEE